MFEGTRPDLFEERTFKSRKHYKCCECGKKIHIGSFYQYSKGKWGETWETFKTCLRCARLRWQIEREQGETLDFLALKDCIRDEYCFDGLSGVKELIRRARSWK